MTTQPKPPGRERDRPRRTVVLLAIALPVLIVAYVTMILLTRPLTDGTELRLDEFLSFARNGEIRDARILERDGRITGTYTGGSYWVAYPDKESVIGAVFMRLQEAGVPLSVDQQWAKGLIGPITLLFPALIFVDAFFLMFLLMREGGGLQSFGRARTGSFGSRTTFRDVAGVEEAVEELRDVKDYLEDPEPFVQVGARVPRGVLLAGAPGCGKTLLARALAGEAQVPFYSISGSDFVEIFVGVGASRIRDLFRQAKQNAPAIVFIDELDAVGRGRQAIAVGGQDEREATLNQLLVEMDGFDHSIGVVVLAATNRLDILDSALLRPGRFDRRIVIDPPDVRGRSAILEIHCSKKPLEPGVDLDAIARRTPGFSGADLANVVNEAAILASRGGNVTITMGHFMEAVERAVAGGPERRSRIIGERERRVIALHEAGHAVVAASMREADAPSKVSIVARGQALGFTFVEPGEDRLLATRSQLVARLVTLLAGRAAEGLVSGEVSTTSGDDLAQATKLAGAMVRTLGMSERLGAVVVGPEDGDESSLLALRHSEALAAQVDEEIRRLLHDAEEQAGKALLANRRILDGLTASLLDVETVEGDDLRAHLSRVIPAAAVPGAGDPLPEKDPGAPDQGVATLRTARPRY
ncbi:MAG: ATP-dependent zinc metalloprotease FtsH [Actinobacteria bacterium]|nr:ATP-dependent zinc metalloprotease FtsH [Actinomycetota bacterium]MDQ3532309.1 ATP-dependent zinc metalloprotease FtsH [Actinomycetota bacterium]